MEETELFKCKYDELIELTNNPDSYNFLKSSAILRSFFFDGGNSLVDKILRQTSQKITFTVVKPISNDLLEIMPDLGFSYDSIVPNNHRPDLIINLNQDDFYRFEIFYHEGRKYTVRQIVKFGANVMGGVHHDPLSNKDPDYAHINELQIKIINTLNDISKVSIIALKPIRNLLA